MNGITKKSTARRLVTGTYNPPVPPRSPMEEVEGLEGWVEHPIDSVIFEQDEDVATPVVQRKFGNSGKKPSLSLRRSAGLRLGLSRESSLDSVTDNSIVYNFGKNKEQEGKVNLAYQEDQTDAVDPKANIDVMKSIPKNLHEPLTKQVSIKSVHEVKDEKRVVIVCHDEEANQVPVLDLSENESMHSTLNKPDSNITVTENDEFIINVPDPKQYLLNGQFSKGSALHTPASLIDDESKAETNTLLIEVSDKLNSMPKHHPITMTNSIPMGIEKLEDSLMKRLKLKAADSPELSESDGENLTPVTNLHNSKRRNLARNALRSTKENKSFDDYLTADSPKMNSNHLTLSVPSLDDDVSLSSTPPKGKRSPYFRKISNTPRLTPRASPRLSPRVAYTNVKKKISEAMKHDVHFMVRIIEIFIELLTC